MGGKTFGEKELVEGCIFMISFIVQSIRSLVSHLKLQCPIHFFTLIHVRCETKNMTLDNDRMTKYTLFLKYQVHI